MERSRDFSAEWARLNDNDRSVFLIDIADGRATIRSKPHFFSEAEITAGACVDTERASLYRAFLAEAGRRLGRRVSLTVALNVSDFPTDSFDAPILAFQKRRGSPNILLPDVDFFYHRWYDNTLDSTSYDAKLPKAIFVGGSTGGLVRESTIREASLPRLALAQALYGHPRIDFRIGAAVQCDDAGRALLEAQPYFSGPVAWEEQLRARFILSVDGNGATCSRVVKTLMSNSILLKFSSDSMLYYFDDLTEWQHYLPIASVGDIERILMLDERGLIDAAKIQKSAQTFCHNHLGRKSVLAYTTLLLEKISNLGGTYDQSGHRSFWSWPTRRIFTGPT